MSKKTGVIKTNTISETDALIYAIDQTKFIMKMLQEAK